MASVSTQRRSESVKVVLGALVATFVFYIEYTGLWRKVHIPFDLEGYFYPLVDAAFLSLKSGHFPLWDQTIYSGIPLAGNIQAALFYPVTWVMFLVNAGKAKVPYSTVQYFQIAHIWIAFSLAYFWLRKGRDASRVASALGAASFAYGGYACTQVTHWGLLGCYAWFPLGFWAVDEFDKRPSLRAIAQLALASALALLAGYPSTWVCFCTCVTAYSLAGRRPLTTLIGCVSGLALSVGLAAVQLMPTAEASALKTLDRKYGEFTAFRNEGYYASFVVPNLYDFELGVDIGANPGKDYMYIGSVAIAALLILLLAGLWRQGNWRRALAPLATLFTALAFLLNPFHILGWLIEKSELLAQMFTDWYFFAGAVAALAPLVAMGVDFLASRPIAASSETAASRVFWIVLLAGIAWPLYLLSIWALHWRKFASGTDSIFDGLIGVTLGAALLWLWTSTKGSRQTIVATVLLLFAFVEYKVFGTSKRLSAFAGPAQTLNSPTEFGGINSVAFAEMQQNPWLRVLVDEVGIDQNEFRHSGLISPQGFDPFLPQQYARLVEAHHGTFRTARHFYLPADPAVLRAFGIGYVATTASGPLYPTLNGKPDLYRRVGPDESVFHVFALIDSKRTYGFTEPNQGDATVLEWHASRRVLRTRSTTPGTFELKEQFYPGWIARVDGNETPVTRCTSAFQCIPVPAGEHMVEFAYEPRSIRIGGWISAAAALLTIAFFLKRPKAA
jgi:hypothetical protein